MHPPFLVIQTQGLIAALVRGQVQPEDLARSLFAISGIRDEHLAAVPKWVGDHVKDSGEAARLSQTIVTAYRTAEQDGRLVWRGPSDKILTVLDRLCVSQGLPSLLATYHAARDDLRARLGEVTYRERYGRFNPSMGQSSRTIEQGLQVRLPHIRLIS